MKLQLISVAVCNTEPFGANLVCTQRDRALKQRPHHRLGAAWGGQGALISIEAGQILLRWD